MLIENASLFNIMEVVAGLCNTKVQIKSFLSVSLYAFEVSKTPTKACLESK